MITEKSFARAGLLGNPSDGFGGKVIAFTIGNFHADVSVAPANRMVFVPGRDDSDEYDSPSHFGESVARYGLYGGIRLLKAAVHELLRYCQLIGRFPRDNFSIQWSSNIPRGVGLAGSSAIVTAALKALVKFWDLPVPPEWLAAIALRAETETLGIPAGPQDRVIQMLGGVVYMDFSPEAMRLENGLPSGHYQSLPAKSPAPLYVAWSADAAEPTEVFHNNLGSRFRSGDIQVIEAMKKFAEFAQAGRQAWLDGDASSLGRLITANFDLRRSLVSLPAWQVRMVEVARSTGASAKFCGSGGAIVGTFSDEEHLARLSAALAGIGCHTIVPQMD
jgi:glucuronokinase